MWIKSTQLTYVIITPDDRLAWQTSRVGVDAHSSTVYTLHTSLSTLRSLVCYTICFAANLTTQRIFAMLPGFVCNEAWPARLQCTHNILESAVHLRLLAVGRVSSLLTQVFNANGLRWVNADELSRITIEYQLSLHALICCRSASFSDISHSANK